MGGMLVCNSSRGCLYSDAFTVGKIYILITIDRGEIFHGWESSAKVFFSIAIHDKNSQKFFHKCFPLFVV